MQELVTLVEAITLPDTPPPLKRTDTEKVEVVEEGEIPEDPGTGTFHYSTLNKYLEYMDVSYPCPIHQSVLKVVNSKNPECPDVYLQCNEEHCPVFMHVNEFNDYYNQCQKQGHHWWTKDRIYHMICERTMKPALCMSRSEKNPNKLYLRCRENNCDLFTGWKYKPNKKTIAILTDGQC